MSSVGSSDLFELIKKLSQSEKRHFKVFASKHVIGDENKYVKLFDAVEKQKEYSEKELQKLSFVVQLPQLKNRLYDLILKSLGAYYATSSLETILRNSIQSIEILTEKRLYAQARKIIKKNKELALKNEMKLLLLEFIRRELQLIKLELYVEHTEEDLDKINKQEKEVAAAYVNSREYVHLNSMLFMNLYREGDIRNQEQAAKYKKILRHPLLQNENSAISFWSKYYYYETLGTYCTTKRDFDTAYIWIKKLVRHIESNPMIKEQNLVSHFAALYNLLICIIRSKKYDQFPGFFQKISAVHLDSVKHEIRRFFMLSILELQFYYETKQIDKGLNLVKRIEYKLKNEMQSVQYPIMEFPLYMYMSFIYFANQQYKKALEWINKILNTSRNDISNVRNDVYSLSKIFSLVIHYELNNKDLLEYNVISTYRYLSKAKGLFKMESAILKFIRTSAAIDSKEEMKEAFKKLREEFIKISKDPNETAFIYFDYVAWLESKFK